MLSHAHEKRKKYDDEEVQGVDQPNSEPKEKEKKRRRSKKKKTKRKQEQPEQESQDLIEEV